MTALSVYACVAGIYIGLYFDILALVPLFTLGAGFLVLTGWVVGADLAGLAKQLVAPLVCLQFGYVGGIWSRDSYAKFLRRVNPRGLGPRT